MQKVTTFLAAMLYGASWVVVVIDLLAIVAAIREDSSITSYLPALIGGLVVIAMVHFAAGWFPFRRAR